MSIVYAVEVDACAEIKAGDDAERVEWVELRRAVKEMTLAFDHSEILREHVKKTYP